MILVPSAFAGRIEGGPIDSLALFVASRPCEQKFFCGMSGSRLTGNDCGYKIALLAVGDVWCTEALTESTRGKNSCCFGACSRAPWHRFRRGCGRIEIDHG